MEGVKDFRQTTNTTSLAVRASVSYQGAVVRAGSARERLRRAARYFGEVAVVEVPNTERN